MRALQGIERVSHAHQCYRGPQPTATENVVSIGTLLYKRSDAKMDKPGTMIWRNRTLMLVLLVAGAAGGARTWPDTTVTAGGWFEGTTGTATHPSPRPYPRPLLTHFPR